MKIVKSTIKSVINNHFVRLRDTLYRGELMNLLSCAETESAQNFIIYFIKYHESKRGHFQIYYFI